MKQLRSGFQIVSPIPFLTAITVTKRVPHHIKSAGYLKRAGALSVTVINVRNEIADASSNQLAG